MKEYIGKELELFALARNWKAYWAGQIAPFIGTAVLEVGAGMGTNTAYLLPTRANLRSWTCLEPDPALASQIPKQLDGVAHAGKVDVQVRVLAELDPARPIDTIIYIDVLEHIEDDRQEVERAYDRLQRHGHLIILGPAHQFLFSKFDEAIGHYRRYDKGMMRRIIPPQAKVVRERYLDAAGMLLSSANRMLLRQAYPTPNQIRFWDRVVVPVSRLADRALAYTLGKSLLVVLKKS